MNQQPIKNDIIIKPMIEVLYPLASGVAGNINDPNTLYLPAKEAFYSSFYNLRQICISSIFNISRQSIINLINTNGFQILRMEDVYLKDLIRTEIEIKAHAMEWYVYNSCDLDDDKLVQLQASWFNYLHLDYMITILVKDCLTAS